MNNAAIKTAFHQDPTVTANKPQKAQGAFRTISEVADELNVQQHVLRFWETKFSQIRPLKRGGGRRYYRPEDVTLLKHVHHLLYTEGYTIKGVQKLLKGQGKQQIISAPAVAALASEPKITPAPKEVTAAQAGLSDRQKDGLKAILEELKELRALVQEAA